MVHFFDFSNCRHLPSIAAGVELCSDLDIDYRIWVRRDSDFHADVSAGFDSDKLIVIEGLFHFCLLFFGKTVRFNTDTLILNTISKDAIFFPLCGAMFVKNCGLYVRNASELFSTSVCFSVKGLLVSRAKRVFAFFSTFFVVGTADIARFVQRNSKKKCIVIPFGKKPQDKNSNRISHKEIRFVVPGFIDFKKKAIRELVLLFMSHFRASHVKLVLLGCCKSLEEKRFLECVQPSDNVIWYSKPVPENIFQEQLQNAEALISVFINPVISSPGFNEYYGITKDSGVDGHAYSYSKNVIRADISREELQSTSLLHEWNEKVIRSISEQLAKEPDDVQSSVLYENILSDFKSEVVF